MSLRIINYTPSWRDRNQASLGSIILFFLVNLIVIPFCGFGLLPLGIMTLFHLLFTISFLSSVDSHEMLIFPWPRMLIGPCLSKFPLLSFYVDTCEFALKAHSMNDMGT
jgi:hypothetical protein